jgi:hypothetical protein
MVLCAFHLVRPPETAKDLFGAWIKSFLKNQRNLVLCGAVALCWSLWKTRNDACFNNKKPNDPANVIYIGCVICFLAGPFCRQTKTEETLRREWRS